MKRIISVTTGTRADYGFLRPILKKMSQSKKLEYRLIVAGMHLSKKHGMTINEIKKDDFSIHAKVPMVPQKDSLNSMATTLGNGIVSFSKVFQKVHPDINLILGDRDEMLASALAACHMNIPNAHIHGGDVSGGIDEYNRHAITKISNIHFAATKKSRERIIKMGENPKYVLFTGSPSIDEIKQKNITTKFELEEKYNLKFSKNEILLVFHPVTTQVNKTHKQIQNILKAILKTKKPTIAIFPNSDIGNKSIFENLIKFSKRYQPIQLYSSLPRADYLGLLKNCGVLVGNSSSGLIEGTYFNISVVNIGSRQNQRERGENVMNVENESPNSIYNAIMKALHRKDKKFKKQHIYGKGTASKKIVNYLEKVKIKDELIQKKLSY